MRQRLRCFLGLCIDGALRLFPRHGERVCPHCLSHWGIRERATGRYRTGEWVYFGRMDRAAFEAARKALDG